MSIEDRCSWGGRVGATEVLCRAHTATNNDDINRPVDNNFTVNMMYQNLRNSVSNVKRETFTLDKHSVELYERIQSWLQSLGVENIEDEIYISTWDFVTFYMELSFGQLLEQVEFRGRKSLAMDVNIYLHNPVREDSSRNDEDQEEDEDEDDAYRENVKDYLSGSGVRFGESKSLLRKGVSDGCCPICLEIVGRGSNNYNNDNNNDNDHNVEAALLPCSHVLDGDCLISWSIKGRPECPLCRTPFAPPV